MLSPYSNASWSGNYVNVEFSGERIEELKRNGESIEIAPLETPVQEVEAADGGIETMPLLEDVQAGDIRIKEDEATLIQKEEGDSIQIMAEHFTIYVITSSWNQSSLSLSGSANVYYLDENGDVEINTESYFSLTQSDITFTNDSEVDSKKIALNLLNGATGYPIHVYYKNGSTVKEIDHFTTTRSGNRNNYTYTVNACDSNNRSTVFVSYNSSNKIDNSGNFYWIVDKPDGHRVEWWINGKLDKVTFVQTGESPVAPYASGTAISAIRGKLYSHADSTKTSEENVSFEGWATQPNDNQKENWITNGEFSPIGTGTNEPVRYYAIFTYKALCYVLLPGKVQTTLTADAYMYVGPDIMENSSEKNLNQAAQKFGKVVVPDGFGGIGNGRWYNGSSQLENINLLFVENIPKPGDGAADKGVHLVYPEYESYSIEWTTLTVAYDSPGYYHKLTDKNGKELSDVIDRKVILHVDGRVGVSTSNEVTVSYDVRLPSASEEVLSAAEQHVIGVEFPLNSTVKNVVGGKITTDKHSYDAVIEENGISYYFDGWYTGPDYRTRADDMYIPTTSVTFYARYVAEDELRYDANAPDATGSMDPTKGKVNEEVTIADNAFKRSGYKFIGWNTKPDGTGKSYDSSLGNKYTLTPNDDVLYAQWEQLTGSFIVQKILKDGTVFDKAKVEDVTFQLYRTDTWDTGIIEANKVFNDPVKMFGSQETNAELKVKTGTFDFSGLPVGYYYLHEVTTTAGYKLLKTDIRIEVRQEGNEVLCYYYDEAGEEKLLNKEVLPVTNEPNYTTALPDTGGPGVGLIKEFGWVLLLLALMMAGMEVQYYGERRRKVRVDEMRTDEHGYEEP